ncbi:MAG: hypothetical protein K8S16_04200 [Bacteroidales bacterium]|nr:hypothetical protein [Bacteroidales bacterium]
MRAIKTTLLSYNVVNLLTTTDPVFCKKIEGFLNSLIKKSILISASAAKERQRFFIRLIKNIDPNFKSAEKNIPRPGRKDTSMVTSTSMVRLIILIRMIFG